MEIGIVIFGVYLGICYWVGMYAKSKGRSLVTFTLLSFFLTPFWGFIIALVLPNERVRQKQHQEMMNALAEQKTNNE